MHKKAHSKLLNKGAQEDVWDEIIDTLSSDNDFITDTIKESDSIDKLYGSKKKKGSHAQTSKGKAAPAKKQNKETEAKEVEKKKKIAEDECDEDDEDHA